MLTSFFIKNNKLFFYKIFFIKQTYFMDEEHSKTYRPLLIALNVILISSFGL